MSRIPIICVALLFTTIVTLQTTAPQKDIIYLPASVEPMKVRPDGFVTASHKVIGVEEAAVDYEEKHGPLTTQAQDYDESDCFLGSCLLEVNLMMAKYRVMNFFRG